MKALQIITASIILLAVLVSTVFIADYFTPDNTSRSAVKNNTYRLASSLDSNAKFAVRVDTTLDVSYSVGDTVWVHTGNYPSVCDQCTWSHKDTADIDHFILAIIRD